MASNKIRGKNDKNNMNAHFEKRIALLQYTRGWGVVMTPFSAIYDRFQKHRQI